MRWVFGYGSLVFRPAFPFVERRPAHVEGFARRFYQASIDHRGVPGAPGRVVTLQPEPGARCLGMAYAVHASQWQAVVDTLDWRERGGYQRLDVPVHFLHAPEARVSALLYFAGADNPQYAGPASLEAMARQVCQSQGPSGSNAEYVLKLDEALRALGEEDPHVSQLASRVRALQENAGG